MPTEQKTQVPPVSEMVGATSDGVRLGTGATHASLEVHAPTGPATLRAPGQRRVFLKIENMRSKIRAPSYDVYLNVPPNDDPKKHPELHAGRLPTFGLVESSRADAKHPGNGLYAALEITDLYPRLEKSPGWDPKKLRVSFVPVRSDVPADVQVGRVSLHVE